MNVREAIECLRGHNVLSVSSARLVCETLHLPFDETLVLSWQTRDEAFQKYGFVAYSEPDSGVFGLNLSYHVAKALGIQEPPGQKFTGKGYQSQANSQAILQVLSERGMI